MTNQKTDTTERRRPRDVLDQRYGAIGISAVAAAVRYQGDAKDTSSDEAPRKNKQGDIAA